MDEEELWNRQTDGHRNGGLPWDFKLTCKDKRKQEKKENNLVN